MISLYFCPENERRKVLCKLLEERLGYIPEIARAPGGKPYIPGNGAYFSLSHSGGICAIALSDAPVGVDTEAFRGKDRARVLASFPLEERAEIAYERDFLMHWTAREAYVKLVGGSIWGYVGRLHFINGQLFLDGKKAAVQTAFRITESAVTAICAESAQFTEGDCKKYY